jgi:hypothetical protein
MHETWGCCNFSGSEVSVANQGQMKRVSHAGPFVDPVDRVPSLNQNFKLERARRALMPENDLARSGGGAGARSWSPAANQIKSR